MATNTIPNPTPRTVVNVAAVLGLVCGTLDVSLAILNRAPSFEHLMLVFPPVFATALIMAGIHGVLWSLAGRRAAARWRLEPAALIYALAVAIGACFTCARIGEQPFSLSSAAQLFTLLFYAALGCATGIGAYFAALAILAQARWRALMAATLLAAPVCLFATLSFVWAQLYWIESVKSGAGILAVIAWVVAVGGIGWFLIRRGDIGLAAAVLWGVSAAALAVPFVLAAYAGISHALDSGGTNVHAVRHVILISADTLRADALGAYGNTDVPTPATDALARDGTVFENDISVTSWTLPSVSTLISGVSPAVHLVRQESDRLPSTINTLAERFAAAGYHTGAIVDNPYLRPKANLDQGFDDYLFLDVPAYANSFGALLLQRLLPWVFRPERPPTVDEHTDKVTKWIARHADRDFFLWVHYFDPHTPYQPPRAYVPGAPPPGMDYEFAPPPQVMSGLIAHSDAEKSWIHALYAGEVRRVDDNVGKVLEQLRSLNLYDGALIAFTSDHGEEFWEHGGQGHGHTLYNELLRVPLILKLPDTRGNPRVARAVISSERLAATLLEAADVEYDPGELSGPSLLPLLRTDASVSEALPVVSAASIIVDNQESVIFGQHKYIRSLVTGREQLFDLQVDAGEQESQLAALPDVAVTARRLLEEHTTAAKKLRDRFGVHAGETAAVDAATLNRLRGLGYIN